MKATLVRKLDEFRGDARLYKVEPPITYERWDDEALSEKTASHIVVSAADALITGPETYIFPADEDGNVVDWGELNGSFRGAFDHRAALLGAGYSVEDAT